MTKAARARPWPTRLATGAAVLVIVLGLTVLAGWISQTPELIQLLPHLPPMTRNTAACFLLCGLALLMLALRGPRWLVVMCAGTVSAVSVLTLVEIVFRVNVGINELLGPSYINVGLVRRGGMAPLTAICFALSSMALLMTPTVMSKQSAMLLGLNGSTVSAAGMVAMIGLWGGVALAALHTAVGLWVLGLGMLALAWYAETDLAGTPRWLPISVMIAVLAGALGVWRALIVGGYSPLSFLPAIVMGGGCLIAPIFGLTVYLAQRGHAQAMALRRSEVLLKEAQHLSSTGSFSWRVATDVVTFSEQTYRLYECDPSRPVTLDLIAARIHPEDMPLWHQMISRARDHGGDLDCEYRLQMPDHSVKHVHLVAHGARDKDDQLEYIGAIQDVTTRRLAEDALGKLRSELAHVARVTSLGALTASIAHELNQPLSGVVTNASTCLRMLAGDPPNIDGARETARRTIRDGNRASAVITRLRALFSKKDASIEPIDLNEAIREVIALSLGELQRNRVVLRTELADDLPVVMGDRVQLQQVILNLCLNASEAMRNVHDRPRDLAIRTAREDGNHVRLTVQDAGVGFEAESLDRLFDAFYTTKNDGMGIGLSVSRSIIESHQGRLWAAQNDGPGATFSFSIPCRSEGVDDPRGNGAVIALHG